MRRLAALFLLVFFMSTPAGSYAFMLHIENGKVLTEKFSLSHIIKASHSASSIQRDSADLLDSNPCRDLWHQHVQLKNIAIPENPTVLTGASLCSRVSLCIACSPAYMGVPPARVHNPNNDFTRQLIPPGSSVQLSSVLLI